MPDPNGLLKEAENQGWIYCLANTPLIALRPPMARLITVMRGILLEDIVHRHGFEEWIFPRLVPEEVLAKTGWLTHHRQEAWLLSAKREFVFDPDEEGLFPRTARFPTAPLPYALDPVQCVSLYYALFGATLTEADLPIRAFEYQGGWSYRYEDSPSGLLRGFAFLRLELIWIALETEAIELRNTLLKTTACVLADQFVMDVSLVEGDSCFEEPPRAPSGRDRIFALEEIEEVFSYASVDVRATYCGTPIEVASAGRHEALPRRFEIKVRDDGGNETHPWSGCIGIGLTRLAACFLSKHGFEDEQWPRGVRRIYRDQ